MHLVHLTCSLTLWAAPDKTQWIYSGHVLFTFADRTLINSELLTVVADC